MTDVHYNDVWVSVAGIAGDVTKVTVSYGVNSIPTAYVSVAPGSAGNTGGGPRPSSPVFGDSVAITAEPGGVLFNGYVSGGSTAHTSGSTGIAVVCHHIAADLAGGPTLSAFSPIAAFDFTTAIGFSSYRNITHYERHLADVLENGSDLVPAILDVLSLFKGFPYIDVSKPQAALALLRGELILKASVDSRAMARALIGTIMTVFNGGTYWHALIAMSDMFKFVVVPTASAIYVFPSVRGVNTGYNAIYKGELTAGAPQMSANPGVKAIVVRGGPEYPISTYDTYGLTRPIFVAETVADHGQVEVVKLPAWLIPMKILNARDVSTEVLARHFTSAVEMTMGIPKDTQDAARRWGRAVVYDNMYQDNLAQITTPVSTNLIPGTNVRVQLPGVIGNRASSFFTGFLDEMRITYDAVGHATARELYLTHVRDDFGSAVIIADEHPLLIGLNPSVVGL